MCSNLRRLLPSPLLNLTTPMNKEITTTLKYGEYLCKSTDDKEKQVLSLDKQREVVERLVKVHSLNIVEEPIVEKQSAKTLGRPGFGKLVKLIREGKIEGIVTWSPHRLSRNATDTGTLITLMDEGLLKEIVTDGQVFRKTPIDIFMFGFLCAQAKLENDTKAIDVRDGLAKVARNGIYPGCPPLGYLTDKYGIKGARKRDIDPVLFPIVRKMWELMLMGTHTPYQILTIATEAWGLRTRKGKRVSVSMIYKMFHNPYYYGEFEFPKKSGVWYKSHHQPMITKDEFDRVQKMIRKSTNPRPIKNYFPFGGCTLHCGECGCAVVGMAKTKTQKNGNVHHYTYYGCTKKRGMCKQPPVSEKGIVVNTETILSSIQIPQSIHQFMLDWVQRENGKQFESIYAQIESNKNALDLNLKRMGGLIDMRAAGLITDTEFQERRTVMDTEKATLSQLVKEVDQNIITWIDTADKLFTFAELAAIRFKNGTPELQRGILVSLGWNLALSEKQLDLSREDWIEPVKRIAKKLNEQFPPLEPLSPLENKGKIEKLLNSPYMCSLLQDVRNSFINDPDHTWFPIVDQWRRESNLLD
jgi:site-specific DNA recombinase